MYLAGLPLPVSLLAQSVGKSIIVKVYSEIYRQHRRKQFPYRQGINIFVSVSVQLL